jgi:hypothetical protein
MFSQEAVGDPEAKLALVRADELHQRRHGRGSTRGRHWSVS